MPLVRRRCQPPLHQQVGTARLQPSAQPWPGAQQRLVGDLHRRLARGRVVVEGEQASGTEGGKRLLRTAVSQEYLAASDAPPSVVAALAGRGQAQQHLARHCLAWCV